MSSIQEFIELTATIVNKEDDMATALINDTNVLIKDTNSNEQVSAEFTVRPGTKFTITGHSKNGSNWHVFMQKKFSNNEWYNVRQINSANPMVTLEDGGTFRLFKPAGITCLVDRD